MAGSISKLCSGCGLDVSDKPRTKDAQGRYFCEACGAKAAAQPTFPAAKPMPPAAPMPVARPAPAAVAPTLIDPIMEKVLSQALPNIPTGKPTGKDTPGVRTVSSTCNACSAAMAPGAAICLVCGYNAATGKVIKTKVLAADKESSSTPGKRRRSISIELGGWGAFVLGIVILGLTFALAMNDVKNDQMFALYSTTLAIWGIITMLLLVITPFREGEFLWGFIILLSPFLLFPSIAVVYYLFVVTDRGSLKGMYISCIVGYILMAILVSNRRDARVAYEGSSSRLSVSVLIAPETPPSPPTYDFNLAASRA